MIFFSLPLIRCSVDPPTGRRKKLKKISENKRDMWAVRGPRLSHQLRCLRHHAGGIRARIPPAFSSPLHCVIVPQQKFSRFIRTTRKGMLVMDGNALWRDSLAIAVETVRAVRAVTAVVHCKTSEFNAHSAKKNNLLSAANGYKYNVSEPFLLHWFAAGRSSSSRYPVHLAVRSVHSAIFWNRINEKLCSFFCFFFFFSFCSIYFSKTLPFFSLVPFVSMAAMLSFHFPTKHSTE